ncbi:unnamed protein product [Linum tenue]|uniref:DNL-type domain-containing protein n=1 Tax=Linum tenue TaxID=586396 RepID=A0AAV0MA69_9ROSI|nr:unnamed protein product [Linum tenue]
MLFFTEGGGQLLPSAGSIFTRSDYCRRRFQTQSSIDSHSKDDPSSDVTASSHLQINSNSVCETRSFKTLSRESYEKGVVVARCGGCDNLHLIADRLGWFGEPGSVEEFLAARGEEVKKGSADTLSLTLEDLAGKKISVEDKTGDCKKDEKENTQKLSETPL